MDVHEFLAVRAHFNRVKEMFLKKEGFKCLSFKEFALLAHIEEATEPPLLSQLADYQHVSRAMITQRIAFFQKSGLVEVSDDKRDKRQKSCSLTDEGRRRLSLISEFLSEAPRPGTPLFCSPPERMVKYADAVGSINFLNKELVVLALGVKRKSHFTIFQISRALVLSPPTTKNVFKKLLEEGIIVSLVDQEFSEASASFKNASQNATAENEMFRLTVKGKTLAKQYKNQISRVKVRRNRIKTAK